MDIIKRMMAGIYSLVNIEFSGTLPDSVIRIMVSTVIRKGSVMAIEIKPLIKIKLLYSSRLALLLTSPAFLKAFKYKLHFI